MYLHRSKCVNDVTICFLHRVWNHRHAVMSDRKLDTETRDRRGRKLVHNQCGMNSLFNTYRVKKKVEEDREEENRDNRQVPMVTRCRPCGEEQIGSHSRGALGLFLDTESTAPTRNSPRPHTASPYPTMWSLPWRFFTMWTVDYFQLYKWFCDGLQKDWKRQTEIDVSRILWSKIQSNEFVVRDGWLH